MEQQQQSVSFERYMIQRQKDKEKKELEYFKERMVGKTFSKLSLKEQNWLYHNQRLIYENLRIDKNYTVPKHI